jgi:U3 small nucleolar RNA-associated protein 14
LYRQIKKKRKSKEETQKLEMMQEQDPKLRWEHFEKLEKDRARERILQKHKNTSKYIKGLRKFADDKQAQTAMNDRQHEKKRL